MTKRTALSVALGAIVLMLCAVSWRIGTANASGFNVSGTQAHLIETTTDADGYFVDGFDAPVTYVVASATWPVSGPQFALVASCWPRVPVDSGQNTTAIRCRVWTRQSDGTVIPDANAHVFVTVAGFTQ